MKAKYYIRIAIVLMVFWILLSGRFELKFILYGIATSLVCSAVCMPLFFVKSMDGEQEFFIFDFPTIRMIGYAFWLLWQLILSNFALARAILNPADRVDPRVLRFKVFMKNPMAITVLANSITLTPGTVTMDVSKEGVFEIHALTPDAAEGIIAGDMQRHVAKLFGEDENFIMIEEEAI